MSPLPGIYASQITGHLGGPVGAYDALATITLSDATSSITFSNIPTGYQHLQIRWISRQSTGDLNQTFARFNGDTGSNYSYHTLTGNGTSAGTAGSAGGPIDFMTVGIKAGSNQASGIFGVSITDVLNYANTNTYKTIRTFSGVDANGSGYIWVSSGNWRNTSAVTSITFTTEVGNFETYSQFALYGMK